MSSRKFTVVKTICPELPEVGRKLRCEKLEGPRAAEAGRITRHQNVASAIDWIVTTG